MFLFDAWGYEQGALNSWWVFVAMLSIPGAIGLLNYWYDSVRGEREQVVDHGDGDGGGGLSKEYGLGMGLGLSSLGELEDKKMGAAGNSIEMSMFPSRSCQEDSLDGENGDEQGAMNFSSTSPLH